MTEYTPVAYPADGDILLRNIGALIEPIGPEEQLLRLFEPYPAPLVRPETPALPRVEAKPHLI